MIDSCFVRDAFDHATDWQRILLRELEVALVVRRHAHHRARAILNQHVVGDPNRHAFTAERIDGEHTGVDALLLLIFLDECGRAQLSPS